MRLFLAAGALDIASGDLSLHDIENTAFQKVRHSMNPNGKRAMTGRGLAERLALDLMKRIQGGELPPESHLSAQKLADRFRVSRSPVREALHLLASQGFVEQKSNRGFFVRKDIDTTAAVIDIAEHSDAPAKYFQFAEDWLRNKIPSEVSEQFLRQHYQLTKGQVAELLTRAANEGWAERKEGYGWRMLPVAKTPLAVEQIYRFRASIEPAALLDPDFVLDRRIVDEQRRIQEKLLGGDIERLSADRLVSTGAVFHEQIAFMSNNPFFYQAVVRANRMRRLLDYRAVVDRARFYEQASGHLQMLDLLERGENLECSYFMKRHLSGALASKTSLQFQPVSKNERTENPEAKFAGRERTLRQASPD